MGRIFRQFDARSICRASLVCQDRSILRSIFVGLSVLVGLFSGAQGQPPPSAMEDEFRQAWASIKNLSPNRADFPPLEYGDYWCEISFRAYFHHFAPLTETKNRDAWLRFFANQFGTHGGGADLRWLLVCQDYTIPGRWPRDLFPDDDPRRRVGNKVCEHIVKNCLEDKRYFHRYGNAVLWSQMCLRESSAGPDFKVLVDTLRTTRPNRIDDPKYWWWARRFMFAVYVTSSRDHLADTSPNQLHAKFDDWLQWYEAIAFQLAAHESSARWTWRPQGLTLDLLWLLLWPGHPPDLIFPDKPFSDMQSPCPTGELFRNLVTPLDLGSAVWPKTPNRGQVIDDDSV